MGADEFGDEIAIALEVGEERVVGGEGEGPAAGTADGAWGAGAGDCAPGASAADVANGLVGDAVECGEDLAGAEVARGVDVEGGVGGKNFADHRWFLGEAAGFIAPPAHVRGAHGRRAL